MLIAKTERLSLRQFVRADKELLYELNSDPDVMRFIGDGHPETREQLEAATERVLGYYDRGSLFGVWIAELKDSRDPIGWFALKPLPGAKEIEIGYRLSKRHWGRGYATEGARCMVARGFNETGLKRLVGVTHPEAGLLYEGVMAYTSPVDGITRSVNLFAAASTERPALAGGNAPR